MKLWKYIYLSDDYNTVPITYEYKIPFVYSVDAPDSDYLEANESESLVGFSYLGLNNKTPRIKAFQIDVDKDHRAVDWNSELIVSLKTEFNYSKDVDTRGLLLGKTYSYNDIDILKITYDYKLNYIKNIEEQSILIEWFNEDGSINSLNKDKGFHMLSHEESKRASYKRRESIIAILEDDIEELVKQGSSSEAEAIAGIEGAKLLLTAVSTEINTFKTSSNPQPLIDKLKTLETVTPLLQSELYTGFTVMDYIEDFLTY